MEPAEAGSPIFPTLVDAVRAHAEGGRSATVGVAGDDEHDYPAFWNRVLAWRAELQRLGLRGGDRVAVEVDTTTEVMTLVIAVLAAGAVLVPLSAAGALRVGARSTRQVRDAVRASGARWCVVVGQPESYREALCDIGHQVAVLSATEHKPSAEVCVDPRQRVGIDPDQPALIQFSSGSVTEPKGILLTHRNLTANLDALTRCIGSHGQRCVFWLPLSHDMGLIGCFAAGLYGGTALRALAPRTFVRDPLRWIRELGEFRATHTTAPPFGFDLARRQAERDPAKLNGVDLSALRVAITGAERIWPNLGRDFEKAFAAVGLRRDVVLPAYGLAENCVAVACREPLRPTTERAFDADELERGTLVPVDAGSAGNRSVRRFVGHGSVLPGTEMRIVSHDGEVLPDGRVGEIRVGGEAASHTLLDADGSYRAARQDDGMIASGDLGAVLDGELFVVGRTKEVLTYAGRMIAPADVEQTVLQAASDQLHGAAAAAVADPDATNEDLVLFLELARPMGKQEERVLARAVRFAVLHDFQVPVRQIFLGRRGTLPRTASGKIQRRRLGTEYLDGTLDHSFRPALPPVRRDAATGSEHRKMDAGVG